MRENRHNVLRACRWLPVVFAMVLAVSLLGLAGCGKSNAAPVFDWNNIQWADGYPMYSDKTHESVIGIDVSEAQGDINWEAVAKDGIKFAFIRVGNRGSTEGKIYPDDNYAYNITAARRAGLTVGAYFYSQARTETEAVEEANLAVQLLKARGFEGQVAFDYEITMGGRIGSVSAKTASACARAFCEVIEKAGFEPVLYGNAEDLGYYDDALMSKYVIWLAAYSGDKPTVKYSVTYWQYTDAGVVDGINHVVDMNVWVKTKK